MQAVPRKYQFTFLWTNTIIQKYYLLLYYKMPRFVKGSAEAKKWGAEMRAKNGIPKLVKGSPEAKAYMAKLRAMRK